LGAGNFGRGETKFAPWVGWVSGLSRKGPPKRFGGRKVYPPWGGKGNWIHSGLKGWFQKGFGFSPTH